jgi:hypothetical protein
VLKISEITQTLYEAGKIDESQYQTLTGKLWLEAQCLTKL